MRGTPDFDGDIDCTPLMEASSAGNLDIVRLLLGYNIDVNTLSATQNTALIYAAAAGHDEVRSGFERISFCYPELNGYLS